MSGILSLRERGKKNVERPNALPLMPKWMTKDKAEMIISTVGRLLWSGEMMWSWRLPSTPDDALPGQEFVSATEAVSIKAIYEAQAMVEKLFDPEFDPSVL